MLPVSNSMARLSIVVPIVAAFSVCISCGASTASQERTEGTYARETPAGHPSVITDVGAPEVPPIVAVPDNPGDRAIRRELNLAIARDADLTQRRISFIVANGDVSVNGTVGSEEERSRINELAMNVPGVKSVANALLIAK